MKCELNSSCTVGKCIELNTHIPYEIETIEAYIKINDFLKINQDLYEINHTAFCPCVFQRIL